MNLLAELQSVIAIIRLYRRLKPDIVHHLTLKPVLYGGIAGRVVGVPKRIHAIMGLGHLFNGTEVGPRLLRRLLAPSFRYALGGPGSILTVENADNIRQLRAVGAIASSNRTAIEVLPGSGVEPKAYDPDALRDDPPIVLFAGRLTRAKGIVDFVEAARQVRSERPAVRFVICGGITEGSPGAIPEAETRAWVGEGTIEWWGYRSDMPAILGRASLVVLPSLHEGLPRVLLEAAAAARVIVATEIPGCREIVRDGVNGFLVPPRSPDSLARAIGRLLDHPEMSARMGREGRRIVEREFALPVVIERTLALYNGR